jgi:hypothetical protein
MKFEFSVPIELHLSPLEFFHWVLKFHPFYDFDFVFTLWKTLLLIGLRIGLEFNPCMGTKVLVF